MGAKPQNLREIDLPHILKTRWRERSFDLSISIARTHNLKSQFAAASETTTDLLLKTDSKNSNDTLPIILFETKRHTIQALSTPTRVLFSPLEQYDERCRYFHDFQAYRLVLVLG